MLPVNTLDHTFTDMCVSIDEDIPSEEFVTIALPVTVIFMVLNTVGLVYAFICLMFNAIFHKKRYHS